MCRISLAFVLAAACALNAPAQFFGFPRAQRFQTMPEFTVAATARCEPATHLVGEGCALILELDVDRKAALDQVRVGGLPEGKDGSIVYGSFENLADGKSATAGHVVKRMRLPIRFLAPISCEVPLTVEGMVGTVQGGSSFFRNFGQRLEPLHFEAKPLPEERRPDAFAGAVGRRFTMKQTLDRDQVRPNDLVTATYTLDFDDYCPSNIFPNVENLSKEFKAYEPKEVSRTAHRVTWTQILVPRTAQATNTALVSVYYYNPHTQRYEVARAYPLKLTFVSAEAASTESTSVAVTGPAETPKPSADEDAETASRPVILRFAPSDGSPVVATLPPGTPVKELATWNGWRRLETPRAIGWSKSR